MEDILSLGKSCMPTFQDFEQVTTPTKPFHLTSARPDIVLVRPREVILLELTIPYNSPESLSKAKERKEFKQNYQLVLSDLDARGLSSSLYTIEIGALGTGYPVLALPSGDVFPH